MATFLRRCQTEADVVCFQELFSVGAIEHVREALAGWTLLLPRAFASGLCIATRLQASDPRIMHYSAGAWADRFVTKGAMSVDVASATGPVRIVVTHMQNAGPITSQYTELREWLQERPVCNTLLVGDFNVDPSRTREELPKCGVIVRTNSATHEAGELDYGWATKDLVVSVETSGPSPADHIPLLYSVEQGPSSRESSPAHIERPLQSEKVGRTPPLSSVDKCSASLDLECIEADSSAHS
jgi:endonuclease/exonuclease/phosphatase family metal-dependent hydrolase